MFTANGKLQIHVESFSKQENRRIKTAQNNSYGQKWHETTNFCVEVTNSKRLTIEEKLGHMVQIHVCCVL